MRDRFSFIIATLSLSLSGVTLLVYFCNDSVFNDLNKATGFWGIVVSAVALVVTCYLVILAIDAFGHVQALSDLKKKYENDLESLNASHKALKTSYMSLDMSLEYLVGFLDESRNNLAESLWESYSQQTASLSVVGGAGLLATEIKHSRGKLGYFFPTISPTKRIQCFDDLAKAGTEEDIAPLQKIAEDESEAEPIRTSAQNAIIMIQARQRPFP